MQPSHSWWMPPVPAAMPFILRAGGDWEPAAGRPVAWLAAVPAVSPFSLSVSLSLMQLPLGLPAALGAHLSSAGRSSSCVLHAVAGVAKQRWLLCCSALESPGLVFMQAQLGLAAEHGYYLRLHAGEDWEVHSSHGEFAWKEMVLPILQVSAQAGSPASQLHRAGSMCQRGWLEERQEQPA